MKPEIAHAMFQYDLVSRGLMELGHGRVDFVEEHEAGLGARTFDPVGRQQLQHLLLAVREIDAAHFRRVALSEPDVKERLVHGPGQLGGKRGLADAGMATHKDRQTGIQRGLHQRT